MSDDPRRLNEDKLREDARPIDDIGPEDESAEETVDGLEDYGYDHTDAGVFEGTAQSDQPGTWMNEEAMERSNLAGTGDDEAEDIEQTDKPE